MPAGATTKKETETGFCLFVDFTVIIVLLPGEQNQAKKDSVAWTVYVFDPSVLKDS